MNILVTFYSFNLYDDLSLFKGEISVFRGLDSCPWFWIFFFIEEFMLVPKHEAPVRTFKFPSLIFTIKSSA